MVVRALDAKYRDDDSVAPSVLFERYRLASRIRKATPDEAIDLSIDEAKLIKDTVPKMYAPGIFGQVWDALEGSTGGCGSSGLSIAGHFSVVHSS